MRADEIVIGRDGIGDPNEPDPAQVATAAAFLRLLSPTRSANSRSPDSYGLKHDAENWGRNHGMEPYVSNGALIVAARDLGYPIWTRGRWPNAAIGVSRPELRKLRDRLAVLPERF